MYSFEGRAPVVDPSAFVAPTATLIGNVTVEAGASVGSTPCCGATSPPSSSAGAPTSRTARCCTHHRESPSTSALARRSPTCASVHGAHVGEEALIANHCTVLDGAVIGRRSLIAAHSLVVGGTKIPDEVLVTGAPAKIRGPIAGTGAQTWIQSNPAAYRELAERYLTGLVEL